MGLLLREWADRITFAETTWNLGSEHWCVCNTEITRKSCSLHNAAQGVAENRNVPDHHNFHVFDWSACVRHRKWLSDLTYLIVGIIILERIVITHFSIDIFPDYVEALLSWRPELWDRDEALAKISFFRRNTHWLSSPELGFSPFRGVQFF